jgi:protein gp37
LPGPATINLHWDRLSQPQRWRVPRIVFVNSMSDLFHEEVPFGFVEQVFDVMLTHSRHTYQVLTKRPQRMVEFAEYLGRPKWPTNVWAGVSVENQHWTDRRIPLLREVLAGV